MMVYHRMLLTFICICTIASATHGAVLEITITGGLNLSRGSDSNNLNGASFTAVYRFDTTAPFTTEPLPPISFYGPPLLAQINFSNRPNGASDTAVGYGSPDRPLMRARNESAPGTNNDSVEVLTATLATSVEFPDGLRASSFTFDFGAQDFFAGGSPPTELVFSTADVDTFQAGEFFASFSQTTYQVTGATFAVSTTVDSDNDGVDDSTDNCTFVPNGPDLPDAGGRIQYDSNGDGFGNACDPDLNNDNVVDFGDLPLFQSSFFAQLGDNNFNEDADLNGDNIVDFGDLPGLQSLFFGAPGPSGLAP